MSAIPQYVITPEQELVIMVDQNANQTPTDGYGGQYGWTKYGNGLSNIVSVFINGTLVSSYTPPDNAMITPPGGGSVEEWAPTVLLAPIILPGPTNDIVVSPGSISDPGAISFTAIVVRGSGASPFYSNFIASAGYFLTLYSYTSLPKGSGTIYKGITQTDTSGLYQYSVNFGPAYNLPVPPINVLAEYHSYIDPMISGGPSYVDANNQIVTSIPPYPSDVVALPGGLPDTLVVSAFVPTFYAKLQSFWTGNGVLPVGVSWDKNGYIKANIPGIYTLYPTTDRGYVFLTLIVKAQNIEVTYYSFAGRPIIVPEVITAGVNGSDYNMVSRTTDSVITASKSVKFAVEPFTFNIIILPVPSQQAVRVARGYAYQLAPLLNLNPVIPSSAFSAMDGIVALNPASDGSFIWPNTSSGGIISVFGVQVATVAAETIDATVSTIFARQGRSVKLFDFFKSSDPGDQLLAVYGASAHDIISSPDGTIRFGHPDTTELNCKVMLSGIEFIFGYAPDGSISQPPLSVVVISDSAITKYVTSSYLYPITIGSNQMLIMIDNSTGQHISITATLSTTEADFTLTSPGQYTIKVKQECLLLYGDSSSQTELHLVPFQALPDGDIPLVKGPNGNATLVMPHGPTYVIDTVNPPNASNSTAFSYAGGSHTFAPTVSKLYICPSNVDAGTKVYNINVIEGQKQILAFVNKGTISNSTNIVPLPAAPGNFIAVSGSDLIVSRNPNANMSITFVVKNNSTGQYIEYLFKVLPPIKLNQRIYFSPGGTYDQFLPTGDYLYAPLTENLIKNKAAISPITVPFTYGEEPGSLELVKYDKTIINRGIYKSTVIPAIALHSTSGDILISSTTSNTYSTGGVTFTQTDSLHITVSRQDITDNVGEYFFVDSTGVATLYNFKNLPKITHDDAYIFSGNQWIADADIQTSSVTIRKGSPYTLTGTEDSVSLYFDALTQPNAYTGPTVDPGYYGITDFAFNIIDTPGQAQSVTFAKTHTITFSDPIDSYMVSLPTKIPFTGSASFKTTHFQVQIVNGAMVVNTIAPGSETIYVITKSGATIATHILQLTALPAPFQDVMTVSYYSGDEPQTFDDLIPSTPSYVPANTVITSPVSNSDVSVVLPNAFTYTFFGDTYTCKYTINLLQKPVGFTATRIIKLNEVVTDFIVREQFGTSLDHVLTDLTSSNNSGLSVSKGANNSIVMTGLIATFPHNPIGYTITATIVTSPGGGAAPQLLTSTITVYVWDPATTRTFVALSTPLAPSEPSISAITGTLLYFERDGNKLEGTSNGPLDWTKFASGTVKVSSKTSTVVPYFLFTTTEVVYFVVIVLPTSKTKTIYFPSAQAPALPPTTTDPFDILEYYFPGLSDPLVDAGVNASFQAQTINFVTGTQTLPVTLTATSITDPTQTSVVPLTTLSYTCARQALPIAITMTPEFVIPMNETFNVTSAMVSPNSVLTTTDASVRNAEDGIIVFYTTETGLTPNIVGCTLTNGVSTLPLPITFTVYNPADTEIKSITSYTPNMSAMFATDIVSYSVDGQTYSMNTSLPIVSPATTHPITTSKYVTGIVGSTLTVVLSPRRPDIVVTLKLKSGKVGIFQGTLNIVDASTKKQFLLAPVAPAIAPAGAVSLTPYQLSSVLAIDSPTAMLQYDPSLISPSGTPATLPIAESLGYPIYSTDGVKVGWIQSAAPSSTMTFIPSTEAGIWNLTGLVVKIGTATFPIYPFMETLTSLIAIPEDIIGYVGKALNINVANFSLIGGVSFHSWQVNGANPPSWMNASNNLITALSIPTAGTYTFTCVVQSSKTNALQTTMTFSLIVVNAESSIDQSVVLVEKLESPLTLNAPAVTIGSQKITTPTLLVGDILMKFNANTITFSTNATLQSPIQFLIVTKDGLQNLVTVSQVASDKDITIVALGYNGKMFQNTSGSVVTSWSAVSGSSTSGPYSPGGTQTIGTAIATVFTDGTYIIQNAVQLSLIISYNLSTGAGKTLTITVGAGVHPVHTIEQSPPANVTLGTNVGRVVIAGHELEDGDTYKPGYADFQRAGNNLIVSNVTSEFEPTLVQAENHLSKKINIVSMLIDIRHDVPTQLRYMVPMNSQLEFAIPFEPSRVTYGDLRLDGKNQEVTFYTDDGTEYGSALVSGTALTITALGIPAFTKALGFMDLHGSFTYAYVKIYDPSKTNKPMPLTLGQSIPAPGGLTYESAGLLDGSEVVSSIPGVLGDNAVQVNSDNLIVTATSLTETLTFYTTLSDGSVQIYTVRFENKNIFVKDLTQIPLTAFVGATIGTPTFKDPSVKATGNIVDNPQALRVIVMLTPVYGQFTINLMRSS